MLVFKYIRSAVGVDELVTIEDCGIVVKYNDTAIKTIDKLEFALDEYGEMLDGGKKADGKIADMKYAKEYKAKVSIATKVKKDDKVVVYYNEGVGNVTGAGKDAEAVKTLVVALIDTNKDAGEKDKYYNELAENVYRPLFPKAENEEPPVEEGPEEEEPEDPPAEPKAVFDFTKAVADDEVKIDSVTYCSAKASSFSAENGLTLEVSSSWDGAFKIATDSLDLSNTNCIIEYKIDDGWEYTSSDGKKCLIQLISKEQTSGEYKAIELSQGEFANDPVETGSWQEATIDNIYKNNWDVVNDDKDKDSYVGADLTKIIAIKINTTDGKGTIHIKSIKFVDKE